MHEIVSPLIDEHLKAISRLQFFSRRLAVARRYGIRRAIRGYEAHVCRSLDLLWDSQQALRKVRK